jgi:uncharacterized protein with FMN-binding domain
MTSPRPGRRPAGLIALLAGVGLVVAARTATGQPAQHEVALPPPTTAPSTTAPPSSTRPRTTTPQPGRTNPSGPHTVDGSVANTPYGPVQVAVTFSGNRIVNVRDLRTPSDANRSLEIASRATPVLRQEVLTAQSARIDSVSGATYTSDGYAQSVQYAIDHAPG